MQRRVSFHKKGINLSNKRKSIKSRNTRCADFKPGIYIYSKWKAKM